MHATSFGVWKTYFSLMNWEMFFLVVREFEEEFTIGGKMQSENLRGGNLHEIKMNWWKFSWR